MKLDLLLPNTLRCLAYDEVKRSKSVSQFFELANMVLISAEAMQTYLKSINFTAASKAKPAKVHLPAFDLDYLQLRDLDGNLHSQRLQDIFSVVQAYWQRTSPLGLEVGLVAGLWRRGMDAQTIIRSLQAFTGPDGKLMKGSGREQAIITAVIEAYLNSKELPPSAELTQAQTRDMLDRWLTATRSAALGTKEIENSVLHWSDYRQLGLIDDTGAARIDRVQCIAEKIFKFATPLTFKEISAWVERYHPPENQANAPRSKTDKVRLKERRKQGKLNRKRGRK